MAKIASSMLISALLVIGIFSSFGSAISWPTESGWEWLFSDPDEASNRVCDNTDMLNVSFAVTSDGYVCNRIQLQSPAFEGCGVDVI